jgi:hypothetical protein
MPLTYRSVKGSALTSDEADANILYLDTKIDALTTAEIAEDASYLYFTNARAIAATLTGYSSTTGTITSSDTVLSAINKLNGNDGLAVKLAGAQTITGIKRFDADIKIDDDVVIKTATSSDNVILLYDAGYYNADNGIVISSPNNISIGDILVSGTGAGLFVTPSNVVLADGGGTNLITLSPAGGMAFNTNKHGFYSTTPIVKPTVTGDWLGNTAGYSLITQLANLGLLNDSTVAGTTPVYSYKNYVTVATTANITLSSTQTIDGVAVVTGDRVLVKNQSTGAENGIYLCNGLGIGWTRTTDADASAEMLGIVVYVVAGTANGGKQFRCSNTTAITLNTTAITYAEITGGGSGTVTSVTGTASRISVGGTATDPVIDIDAAYVGQTSITTLGTIATGVWSGTTILANKGGTGFASYAVGDLLYADTTSTLAKLADVAAGSYLRSGGVTTAPVWSTLILPNAITANRVVFGSATNTYGSSANITFDDSNSRLRLGGGTSTIGVHFEINKDSEGGTVYLSNNTTASSCAINFQNASTTGVATGVYGFNRLYGASAGASPGALVNANNYAFMSNGGPCTVGSFSSNITYISTNNTARITISASAGDVACSSTTEASSATVAGFTIASGLGVNKKLFVTGAVSFASTLGVTGVLSVTNTTNATSSSAAALTVAGGVGIVKDLYVDEDFYSSGSIYNLVDITTVEYRLYSSPGGEAIMYINDSSGTDIAGTDLHITPGAATGSGASAVLVLFSGAPVGATGTAVRNCIDVARVTSVGITTGYDMEVTDLNKGVILKSPDGTRYRVRVANGGTISIAAA